MRASRAGAGSWNQVGMTLVELVVAMLLGGGVLLGLGYVFALTSGQWLRGHAKLTLQADGSRALEEISRAAGHAGEYAMREGELSLAFPASPMGPPGTRPIVFRLRDQILYRDGLPLVPFPGDTSVGVAEFLPEPLRTGADGVEVLRIRLKLFARLDQEAVPDTMQFETLVYPRNRGLGLQAGAGASQAGAGAAAGTSGSAAPTSGTGTFY